MSIRTRPQSLVSSSICRVFAKIIHNMDAKTRGNLPAPILILLLLSVNCLAENTPRLVLKALTLTGKEIGGIYQGSIVSKTLETADKRELAVLGATMVDVPPETVVDAVRDITKFKTGKEVLGIGKFSKFEASEMKSLALDDDEQDALAGCAAHNCGFKLPAAWIETLSREKDPGKREEKLRELLSAYAKDYSGRGGKAVVEYNNKKDAIFPQKEFESILAASPYLSVLAPEFYQYLKDFPQKPLPDTEDFIYWSSEKFGFKPVVSLTHVSISRWRNAETSGWLIASRQIFADHYYDASLGLTLLMDRPAADGRPAGCYLIYINRSRVDILGGFLSSLRRAIAIPKIRGGLENHMKGFKERLEDKPDEKKSD